MLLLLAIFKTPCLLLIANFSFFKYIFKEKKNDISITDSIRECNDALGTIKKNKNELKC